MANAFVGAGSPRLYIGNQLISGGNPDYSLTDGFTEVGNTFYNIGHNFDWTKPFEIQLCVILLADIPNDGNAKHITGPRAGAVGVPLISMSSSGAGFCAPAASQTDVASVTVDTPFAKNVPIWLRATYDGGAVGVGKIGISLSFDGENFDFSGEKVITIPMIYDQNLSMEFGGFNGMTNPYSMGAIAAFVWNECYVKINGEYAWGREPS